MKNIFILLLISFTILSMFSCSTQKVNIYGKPGTEIYSAEMRKVADIQSTGVATVKISVNHFTTFMYSHEKDSDEFVPFAINFKTDRHLGAVIPSIVTFYPIGWIPCLIMCKNDHIMDQYSYVTDQKTNQDIVFATLKQDADYKNISSNRKSDKIVENKQNTDRKLEGNKGSGKATGRGSVEYSSSVAGSYVGKGRLIESGEVIERFDNMTLVIKACSDNMVKVSVKVGKFSVFNNDSEYTVSKNDGVMILKNKELNSTIRIDEYGDLTYECKNMSEYGSDGVLKITAERK